MAEFYIPNRDLIKNLKINTGTSQNPSYTALCSTSELTLNQEMETKDWFTFCDSLKRSLITGVSMTLEGTLKLDVNNSAVINILGKVDTLLTAGTISQFNNIMVQFDLLTSVSGSTLTYKTYSATVILQLEGLGGNAEDEAEVGFTMTLNGTATASA